MRRYPPIAEHGLVGDLQTCALVSSEGVLDWFCSPRFDSPSIFAALLDHDRGGHFTITVDSPGTTVRQLYLADTAILVTRFLTPEGVGEVVDFMPVDASAEASGRHRIVRAMRAVRGTVTFGPQCRPRFDYGRLGHELVLGDDGSRFTGPGVTAHLQTAGPVPLERDGDDVGATVMLHAGELAAVVLTVDDADAEPPYPVTEESLWAEFTAVRHFWTRLDRPLPLPGTPAGDGHGGHVPRRGTRQRRRTHDRTRRTYGVTGAAGGRAGFIRTAQPPERRRPGARKLTA
jgi:hypothetical protein